MNFKSIVFVTFLLTIVVFQVKTTSLLSSAATYWGKANQTQKVKTFYFNVKKGTISQINSLEQLKTISNTTMGTIILQPKESIIITLNGDIPDDVTFTLKQQNFEHNGKIQKKDSHVYHFTAPSLPTSGILTCKGSYNCTPFFNFHINRSFC